MTPCTCTCRRLMRRSTSDANVAAVAVEHRLVFYAKRDIAAGEELVSE